MVISDITIIESVRNCMRLRKLRQNKLEKSTCKAYLKTAQLYLPKAKAVLKAKVIPNFDLINRS